MLLKMMMMMKREAAVKREDGWTKFGYISTG